MNTQENNTESSARRIALRHARRPWGPADIGMLRHAGCRVARDPGDRSVIVVEGLPRQGRTYEQVLGHKNFLVEGLVAA